MGCSLITIKLPRTVGSQPGKSCSIGWSSCTPNVNMYHLATELTVMAKYKPILYMCRDRTLPLLITPYLPHMLTLCPPAHSFLSLMTSASDDNAIFSLPAPSLSADRDSVMPDGRWLHSGLLLQSRVAVCMCGCGGKNSWLNQEAQSWQKSSWYGVILVTLRGLNQQCKQSTVLTPVRTQAGLPD